MPSDQLVQHRALGRPAPVAGQWPAGRTARPFVEAACKHPRAKWKFHAVIAARFIATFRSAASDVGPLDESALGGVLDRYVA